MKKFLASVSILAVLSLFFAVGCKEKPKVNNQSPTCSITAPFNDAVFNVDESISITVVAEDSDSVIAEVQLYIDGVSHSIKAASPYNFTINAGELDFGAHTLRAVAKDNDGLNGESSIIIKINPPSTESPDFVSFSDGKIPNTWQTTAWMVDNTLGYDDIYSLRAVNNNVAMITNRTCNSNINFVEFYLSGGSVSFSIDGTKVKDCSASGWTKFGFYLEAGVHTLKWESTSASVYLDAIRFRTGIKCEAGMNFQGGTIAYVDNSGEHGLIAAPSDQSEGIQWYNGTYISTGANGTAIGTGQTNTTRIVQIQGDGSYAAKICDDLVLNGYNDWFLPSKDELNELYKNRNVIDGFNTSANYWSSSEGSNYSYYAWYQGFSSGNQDANNKDSTFRVRAVRAF